MSDSQADTLARWFHALLRAEIRQDGEEYAHFWHLLESSGVEIKLQEGYLSAPEYDLGLVSAAELARQTNLHERTIREWYRRDLIPGFQVEQGCVYFHPLEVVRALYRRWGNKFREHDKHQHLLSE